jgi:tripartite-type tricarboxylate transporter receptor subunit TctC
MKLPALVLAFFSSVAFAQTFPSHPVKIVVAFPPGGSTDITARLLAPKLAELWKQPVLVENKPGAGANIGTDYVAKSAPDGHTLLLATTAFAVSAAVYEKLPYDPLKDLAPVVFVSSIPNLLVVNPALPASTPKDFVQYAKANAGKLSFSSPADGTAPRLRAREAGGHRFPRTYSGRARRPGGDVRRVQAMINLSRRCRRSRRDMKAIAVTTKRWRCCRRLTLAEP